MTSIFFHRSIPELHDALSRGDLSCFDMVDAVKAAIGINEAHTYAWVCYDLKRLQMEAEHYVGEKNGFPLPLACIPFGVKDIFNTKGYPTEMGSPIWKNFTPGNNARVVDSLINSGGLMVGKTVTAEFAVHELNATLNPHDPSRTPGTSSSGSAAAVATGMVPFALGTQTAGSIIRPASFCGIWGMKPSFGMIPRTGVLKTTDSLDTIGFLAAHGKSLRTILDCVRVKGPDYPFVYRQVDARGAFPKDSGCPWKVGFVKTHVWNGALPYTKKAIEDVASKIAKEQDFEVEDLELPEIMSSAHQVHTTIYNKSLAYYFQHEATVRDHMSEIMAEMIAAGESISVAEFQKALRLQAELARTLDDVLSRFDIVLSLSTSSDAPPRSTVELPDPSLIWTLCHVPAISAPVFRSPDGLPFGAQFISRKWNDYLLLQGIETLIERSVLSAGIQALEPLSGSICKMTYAH